MSLPFPKREEEEPARIPWASSLNPAKATGERTYMKRLRKTYDQMPSLWQICLFLLRPFRMPDENYIPSSWEIFSYAGYLRDERSERFLPPAVEIFISICIRLVICTIGICGLVKVAEILAS